VTGLSREVLGELVAELGPRWQARQDARLADRPRKRAVGAGARYRLVFLDRLLATLVHLRHGVTHDVLACWFGVSRSTITRAIGEVCPLLAERGCTVEGGIRLRTLADVVAHLGASGRVGLLDAPRSGCAARPQVGPVGAGSSPARPGPTPGRALVITDAAGRLLFCGQTRPGAIHDLTQVRQAGLVELRALIPGVTLLADAGYQDLSAQMPVRSSLRGRPGGRTRSRSFPPSPRHTRPNAGLTRRSGSASSTASTTRENCRALARHLGRRDHLDTILPRGCRAGLQPGTRSPARNELSSPDRLRRPPKALLAGTAR
jgi:hypothetical protein